MARNLWLGMFIVIGGTLTIANGLIYFLNFESFQNSLLRNFAVFGQIVFGFLTVCYGVWRIKLWGALSE